MILKREEICTVRTLFSITLEFDAIYLITLRTKMSYIYIYIYIYIIYIYIYIYIYTDIVLYVYIYTNTEFSVIYKYITLPY